MSRWIFEPQRFNGDGEPQQLGSIRMPNGQWFAAVEDNLIIDGKPRGAKMDMDIVCQVIAVLNRELPDGKPRKRKKVKE